MSRTHHPKWKARRYVMRDRDYVERWVRPRSVRDAEDLVSGELEYRDVVVPSVLGLDVALSALDYTSVDAARAAFEESITVHHRRPARRVDNAVARRLMKRLSRWRFAMKDGFRGRGWVADVCEPARPRLDLGFGGVVRRTAGTVSVTIQISF